MKKLFTLLVFACVSNFLKAQIPTGSLTAYWPFTPTLHANDSTTNGNNGVVYGATMTADRFGNCNQAYKFNGINNSIVVPNSSTIDMNNTDFSIALWIKTYAGDTNSTPLAKNVYGSVSGYLFWANCGNIGYCSTPKHGSFYVAAGGQQDACSDLAIYADSSWHFLTGVYNHNTNKTYLYVDSVLQTDIGQAYNTTYLSNTQNLAFGGHNDTTHLRFKGALDDIRIYKRMLSGAEIAQLYKEPSPGSICPLGAISKFNTQNSTFQIYPNPAQNNFTVEVSSNEKQTLSMFDINGKQVLSQTINGTTNIDASSLSAGVYNISITKNQSILNKKIIVIK